MSPASSSAARRLWAADHDWWAPRLLAYGLETGTRMIRLLQQEPQGSRILEIASKLGLSAYDATYLAAAERLRVPLVTEDGRLLRAAPQIARQLA